MAIVLRVLQPQQQQHSVGVLQPQQQQHPVGALQHQQQQQLPVLWVFLGMVCSNGVYLRYGYIAVCSPTPTTATFARILRIIQTLVVLFQEVFNNKRLNYPFHPLVVAALAFFE